MRSLLVPVLTLVSLGGIEMQIEEDSSERDLDLVGAVDCLYISNKEKMELIEAMEWTLMDNRHCEKTFMSLVTDYKLETPRSREYSNDFKTCDRLFETIDTVASRWNPVPDLECLKSNLERQFMSMAVGHGLTSATAAVCDVDERYRSFDGTCNNLQNPNFGAAFTPFLRFMDPEYEGDLHLPRGGRDPSRLPGPREVSRAVHQFELSGNSSVTQLLMMFGEFLDHDIALVSMPEFDCCNPTLREIENRMKKHLRRCFNIQIKCDCDFYKERGVTCHPYSRASRDIHGNQINGVTSFIDGSQIYGSDQATAKKLRTWREGTMLTHELGDTLPSRKTAGFQTQPPHDVEDLVAGDVMAGLHPGHASMHSLFLNEHNRIARRLKEEFENLGYRSDFYRNMSPSERDEMLYQETRRLMGALLQNIAYSEWLPLVLGREGIMEHYLGLDYTEYNARDSAAVRDEFVAMDYWWVTLAPSLFVPVNRPAWTLRSHWFEFKTTVLGESGADWKNIIEGMMHHACSAADTYVIPDITNFYLCTNCNNQEGGGEDAIARLIQHGRDHGIPSYNKMRQFCGLEKVSNMNDKPKEISWETWRRLNTVYRNPEEIDVFTGGLSEEIMDGGLVGATFSCIVGKQFHKLKSADRFFFTHGSERGLRPRTQRTVRRRRLGNVICDNTGAATTREFAMSMTSSFSSCPRNEDLDFDAIVEEIIGY